MALASITINGKQLEVESGITIFKAAEEAGIHIPHLCHHPQLVPSGACRLCVVEVEKARNLQAACTTPVADGMVIHTHSPRVVEARRVILDLLLSNHPEDCLTCDKAGDCKLQHYAYEYGVPRGSYKGERKYYELDESNPFFIRDYNKCILCGRCVRMCDEVQGVSAIDYAYRGFKTKIAAAYDQGLQDSPCVFCGNCVQVCPVGALMPKASRGKGRAWQIRKVRTICPYCGVGCAINLHVRDNEVVGVSGADGPANHGLLCVKGRFGYEFINSPDRLKTPLIKENGEFREASWDEALDLVAERLGDIKAKYGPNAIGVLSSAKCTNEENYLMQKFARAVLGTNNVDHCARLCHASTVAGLAVCFGSGAMTNSIGEISEADVIFIIGSNTTEAHPVIGNQVVKALKKGAKLIVADPRRIALAERADIYMQQVPGTDVALLNAIMHVIVKEKLHDTSFIGERTEGFSELVELLEEYPPEKMEGVTGVPADLIRRAARTFATARNASILYAMGITQHTKGTENVFAIANLAMLTGNVGKAGSGVNPLRGQNNVQGACDMGALPNVYPGYQVVSDPNITAKFEAEWGVQLPAHPGLTVVEMMNAAIKGDLKAMYIMGENPMVTDPDINHVREALEKLEFLVVQDIFLTETAALATVVLPACCFAEKDGTVTNTERRVQRIQKAVNPPGESKLDSEIIIELAKRMGYHMNYKSPEEVMQEIARVTPSYGGITYSRLGDQGLQWPCPTTDHPGTKFLHQEKFARGRGLFKPTHYKPAAEMPDKDYPYVFTTGRILYQYHSGSMSRRSSGLRSIADTAFVEINPALAKELGISDGEMVKLISRRGQVVVRANVTDRTGRRVLFMPFHFAEAAANLLTNPALDPTAKIPEFKVCAVRVEKLR